ncbi:hypothetical protein ACFL6M_01720 [Candidatus Eisenbacteria bacterium]|uniref:Uncharacterized protein n=1 Tax=Eiseniibacteriota bacterium TaxID=2212470 RepID=A0ABV6YJ06_UNCEI
MPKTGATMYTRPILGFPLCVLLIVVFLAILPGCGGEGGDGSKGDWWSRVTGIPGDALGFEDRWESCTQGKKPVSFASHVQSADLARIDFTRGTSTYSVIFNNGRTLRAENSDPHAIPVDRTLLLTYMLPYLGRARLGAALASLDIDTTRVVQGVEWNGHQCLVVGMGSANTSTVTSAEDTATSESGAESREGQVPLIYFDEETGAVLRLVTVAFSPIGKRVGDFRLYDHIQRGGAYLPTRFETWGKNGLRSCLKQASTRDGHEHPPTLFRFAFMPQRKK